MPLSQSEKQKLLTLNLDHASRLARDRLLKKRKGLLNKVLIKDQQSYISLLERLRPLANRSQKALELGCANGSFFPLLRRYFKEVSGIDLNPDSVNIAVQFKYSCQVAFIEELPFPDQSFDVVLSRHVLEHTISPVLALKEIHRILRPGGITANITPHYFPDPEPAHISQLTLEQWLSLYKEIGFQILHAYLAFFNATEAHIIAMKI